MLNQKYKANVAGVHKWCFNCYYYEKNLYLNKK